MQSDKRFYSDYHDGQLCSQAALHKELLRRRFETGNQRILSTSSYGIPITLFLLLIGEALDALRKEQDAFTAGAVAAHSVDMNQIAREHGITIDGLTEAQEDWERARWWDVAPAPALSGVSNAELLDFYFPKGDRKRPVSDFIVIGAEGWSVGDERISFRPTEPKSRSLLGVLKPTMSLLEFFYATQQRLREERRRFKQVVGRDCSTPSMGREFESWCSKRTALIHDGELSLRIDYLAELRLAREPIVGSAEKALAQAVTAAEAQYSEMLRLLT